MPASPIVLMGGLHLHGGTTSSWGDCVLMRGLHVRIPKRKKKDPPAWTMLYSQASPCVLTCQLHPQRKDHQRGPCLTAGITLHTSGLGASPEKGPAGWTMLYSQANPYILMGWLHIPSKAHHHNPGPTARLTLACLWLTAFPMKGPPVGPYTPHSRTDPCVLKGDCISEEKWTSPYSHRHAYGGLHPQRSPPAWSRL